MADDTTTTSRPGCSASTAARAHRRRVIGEVGLGEHGDGLGVGVPRLGDRPLDPTRLHRPVEAEHDEDVVEVGGEHLLALAHRVGPPQGVASLEHGGDLVVDHGDPVAHDRRADPVGPRPGRHHVVGRRHLHPAAVLAHDPSRDPAGLGRQRGPVVVPPELDEAVSRQRSRHRPPRRNAIETPPDHADGAGVDVESPSSSGVDPPDVGRFVVAGELGPGRGHDEVPGVEVEMRTVGRWVDLVDVEVDGDGVDAQRSRPVSSVASRSATAARLASPSQ